MKGRTYTEQRHFTPIDNLTKCKASNAGHEEQQLINAVEVLEKSEFFDILNVLYEGQPNFLFHDLQCLEDLLVFVSIAKINIFIKTSPQDQELTSAQQTAS